MTADIKALVERLEAACVGHPSASIPWPHRILHEAAAALTAQSALLDKAVEALEPFAETAGSYDPEEGDGAHVAWAHDFTIASLRRARSTLSEIKEARR